MRRSYTSAIEAGLAKHYRTLEQEIMSDIVRRIKKAGKITSTADWQLNRLIFLGKSSEDLKKLVASAVQFDDAEVEKLYQAVIEEEYTVYRKQYEEITKEFIPYSENLWLQQITEAMIRQTKGDLINITRSMGFMLKQGVYTPLSAIYDDYLDQAIVDITSGAFDYNTVIRRVVGEMTRSGLRTDHAFSTNPTDYTGIDYPSGWHNRIDVAARRAILTGVSQLTDQITRKNAEILGVDRFEVSWHVGARPEHAEWQGKVYTMDQLEDICGLGTGAGLLGWNCRHSYYLFFPGSERQYTDEWLEEQREAEAVKQSFRGREYNTYEATQKQRRMETNMRAQRSKVRLLEEGEADPDDIVIAKCKYQAQLDEYKEFSKKFRLPEQKERIYTDLKGRVAPSRQNYEKWRTGYFTKSAKEERDR
ncbi:MAG: phage minor capsid protein, partial [Lachnospiraceae bacterium]|nr:phage minor capsid protein [Lachnospiraceae bacterium]